jgi:hypothetical protein
MFAGSFAVIFTKAGISFSDLFILTLSFAAIGLVSLVIFLKGRTKDPAGQTMHMLVAISLKFLLELVLALIWFFVSKKTSAASLLLFFVLYLCFSLYLANLMLNILKHKSL